MKFPQEKRLLMAFSAHFSMWWDAS